MITYNGIVYINIEDLEVAMDGLSESQKQFLRNDFNGVANTPVTSIQSVTNQQLRTALVLMSFQQNKPELHPDAIRAFVDSQPEPNRSLALQQWEYSNEMLRNNPLVASMAAGLGLTSADLDNLWNFARTL